MSNLAVIQQKDTHIQMWESDEFLSSVKEVFAKDLSNIEFKLFLEMGKALNLNPFTREIWAVKYANNPAQIFIGRDGYRKVAQRNPDYEYHYVEAVYANDKFEAREGVYEHQFNLKDRGVLRGAFCKIKKKSSERPFCLFVPFDEYNKGSPTWKSMPSTMIKKVAEAQCLRMCFQDMFAGTYDEAENWVDVPVSKPQQTQQASKPVMVQQQQVQQQTQAEKEFSLLEEFKSKSEFFLQKIDDLCIENIGKYEIDKDFESSFKDEFFQKLKDRFVKNDGQVDVPKYFEQQLTVKRILALAYNHNSKKEFPMDEKELNALKKQVFDEYYSKPNQNLVDIFTGIAEAYVEF